MTHKTYFYRRKTVIFFYSILLNAVFLLSSQRSLEKSLTFVYIYMSKSPKIATHAMNSSSLINLIRHWLMQKDALMTPWANNMLNKLHLREVICVLCIRDGQKIKKNKHKTITISNNQYLLEMCTSCTV